MNHNDKIKLTDVQLYREDNEYFLSLKYHGENLEREYEIEIPKVSLNIRQNEVRITSDFAEVYGWTTPYKINYAIELFYGDTFPIHYCAEGYPYKETTIKEKKRKMTVSEIEKALGYKVEIVSKK